jgi:hypothetical protein
VAQQARLEAEAPIYCSVNDPNIEVKDEHQFCPTKVARFTYDALIA